jgi:hypothetical protein
MLVAEEVPNGLLGVQLLDFAQRFLGKLGSRGWSWTKNVRGGHDRRLAGVWAQHVLGREWVSGATSDNGTLTNHTVGELGGKLLQHALLSLELGAFLTLGAVVWLGKNLLNAHNRDRFSRCNLTAKNVPCLPICAVGENFAIRGHGNRIRASLRRLATRRPAFGGQAVSGISLGELWH